MTDLIVNNKDPRRQYTVTSITQLTYAFDFEFLRDDDVAVYLTPVGVAPDPLTQILTLYTDYTIFGAGITGGGSITILPVITLAIGDIITIERNLPYDRLTDFSVGGQFKSVTINDQLDRIVMQIQQVDNLLVNRGLTYLVTEELTAGNTVLPKLAPGQYWKANGAGNLIAAVLTESPDWSTLRAELASETVGAPGAGIVGYYDAVHGTGNTTVDAYLKLLVAEHMWETGDVRITLSSHAYGDAAKPGWVWMRDYAIGSAASNAAERANDDTHDLFIFVWNRIPNTDAPVFASGQPVARGISADADWLANRQIILSFVVGRALAVSGVPNGESLTPRTLGSRTGTETVGLTDTQNGTHAHTVGVLGSGPQGIPGVNAGGVAHSTGGEGTYTSGLGTPHNNIPPTVFFNIQIKL